MGAPHGLRSWPARVAFALLPLAAAAAAEERRDFAALAASHTQTARASQPPVRFDAATLSWWGAIEGPMPRGARGAVVCSTLHLANGGGVRRVKATCGGELAEVGSGLAVVRRIELPLRKARSDASGYAKFAWSDEDLGGFITPGADYRVTATCSATTKNRRKAADTVRTACSLIYRVPCLADAATLCLGASRLSGDGRFRIEVQWRAAFEEQLKTARGFANGANEAVLRFETEVGNQVGELRVSVEDHCRDPASQRFWVRANGSDPFEYLLRVTDTESGVVREYAVEAGEADRLQLDKYAFDACP